MSFQPLRTPALRIPNTIPIFPLPNVVLFPQTVLPLHIFEPRYREMVQDVQQSEGFIGIVLLKDGWEHNYYQGTPRCHQLGCVGKLTSVHLLADGRSNITLEGLTRYESIQEIEGKSYRQAHIALQEWPTPQEPLSPSTRLRLGKVVKQYLEHRQVGKFWKRIAPQFLRNDRDEQLLNMLSSWLDFTPMEKQFLLESTTLLQHSHRLIDLIQLRPLPTPELHKIPRWG